MCKCKGKPRKGVWGRRNMIRHEANPMIGFEVVGRLLHMQICLTGTVKVPNKVWAFWEGYPFGLRFMSFFWWEIVSAVWTLLGPKKPLPTLTWFLVTRSLLYSPSWLLLGQPYEPKVEQSKGRSCWLFFFDLVQIQFLLVFTPERRISAQTHFEIEKLRIFPLDWLELNWKRMARWPWIDL